MVSKIMLRFSACPASQRNVRLQFNRKVSWIECVYTGSNPADALTRRGGESAARYARLSSEALGFMGIGKKPIDHGSSSLKRYSSLVGFIFGAHRQQITRKRWSNITA